MTASKQSTPPTPTRAREPGTGDMTWPGTVLRTRERVRPVYVSPGHRLDYDTAAAWVMACCTRYRLPEPIRTADRLASRGG